MVLRLDECELLSLLHRVKRIEIEDLPEVFNRDFMDIPAVVQRLCDAGYAQKVCVSVKDFSWEQPKMKWYLYLLPDGEKGIENEAGELRKRRG